MISLEDMKQDTDWCEAFSCATRGANFGLDDVQVITHAAPGYHDGDHWVCVGTLKDGHWFMLEAGCCYSGWDCSSGGDKLIAKDFEYLARFALTQESRSRLGIVLQEIVE